ncbi:MAG: hypothetical protein BroJett015_27790 [Chloroflexota bacterium]|nr:MAG: hypothetical protein BroJett015_27790 [Chloroflexota bacterium]
MTSNLSTEKEGLLNLAATRSRHLSLERLRVANDFLAYLEEREENEATAELLNIEGFEEAFTEAQTQVKNGDLVSFNAVRRNV